MGKIIVQIDDMPEIEVPKRTYCEAKAKQLIEFGYSDITADDVEKQVDLLLSGGGVDWRYWSIRKKRFSIEKMTIRILIMDSMIMLVGILMYIWSLYILLWEAPSIMQIYTAIVPYCLLSICVISTMIIAAFKPPCISRELCQLAKTQL